LSRSILTGDFGQLYPGDDSSGMFPRQAVYKLLLRQGLINFARVGTAVPCLPSMFRYFRVTLTFCKSQKQDRLLKIEQTVLL